MADGQNDDIQLSFGFDTDKVAKGGDMIVKKMSEIQDATKKMEAQAVATNKAIAISDEERYKHEAEMLAAARARFSEAERAKEEVAKQAALRAADNQRRISGEAARASLEQIKKEYLQAELAIKEQFAKGLIDQKGMKLAARQNATFYRDELRASMQGSAFQDAAGKGGAAVVADATRTLASLEKTAAATEKVGFAAKVGSMGLGRLRYSMISLMDSMVGLPPVVGRVGGALASLALPLAPLIAVVAGLAAMGAAYKYLKAPQEEIAAAQEKYNEVAQKSAQYTREFGRELGVLNQLGTGVAGKGLKEIREEADKINGQMTSNVRAYANALQYLLRDVLTRKGEGSSTLFYADLSAMNEKLDKGKMTLKQYKDELIAMGKASPGIQDLVQRQLMMVAAVEALRDKQAQMAAETNYSAAQTDEFLKKYGTSNPLMAKAYENLDKLREKVAAARSGGTKGVQSVSRQQDAMEQARAMWEQFATQTEQGRKLSKNGSVTFDAAYRFGDPAQHAQAAAMLQLARDEAKATDDVSKATEEYNKRIAEQKRIKEELFRLNKAEADNAAERKQALADQQRLAAAANEGAEAYTKVNTQLAQEAKIRAAMKQIRDQATDSETHKLLISSTELARRQKEAADAIRAQDTAQDTNKDRLSVTELRAEVEQLERSAVAHAKGKEATAEENIEIRYQADLRKANAMGLTDEAQAYRNLAQSRKEAAQRDLQAQKEGQDREAKVKVAAEREGQERLKVFTETTQVMGSVFDQFLTGAIGRGRKAWQTLWDDMKGTFERALAGILANFAAKKIAGALAGVFSLGVPAVAGASTVTGPNGGTMTMGISNNLFSPEMLAKQAPTMSGMQRAAGAGMALLGGATAGYATGSMLYSTSHGKFGNMARGALGGAATGAATGFAVGGPIGAAVGAVAGFVAGIFGAGSAAKEAKKQMDDLRKSLNNNILAIKATVSNNGLEYSLAQVKQQFDDLRKQTEQAYQGGGKNSQMVHDRNAQLDELNKLEAQRIAQLQQEDALQRKNFAEDLQVRLLAAQGKQVEADALQLKLTQEREYADAVKNNADAATLALLAQVQAQEAIRAATLETTSALLNVPTGFKVARMVFESMPYGTPNRPAGGVDFSTPGSPMDGTPNLPDVNVTLTLDGKVIATQTVKTLKGMAPKQGLAPNEWSQVQVS